MGGVWLNREATTIGHTHVNLEAIKGGGRTRRAKPPRPTIAEEGRGDSGWGEDPGDDRLSRLSTIMGPAGLTAVFGMGTGVAPPVWSPGRRPAGG